MLPQQNDFIRFSELVLTLDEGGRRIAWSIAHKQGIPQAIAFCQRRILVPC
jgi:hypothetical protein